MARGALAPRLLVGLLLFVAVAGALAAWGDVRQLLPTLGRYLWWTFFAALATAALNYALRFVRWQMYLSALGLTVPAAESATVFVAGLSLAVTPGKIGDVLKSFLLRASRGIPIARTVPIVLAERLTDLLAVILLGVGGAFSFGRGGPLLAVAAGLSLALVLLVGWRRGCLALLGWLGRWRPLAGVVHKIVEAYTSFEVLLRPRALVGPTLLAAGAWLCECFGFWLILRGFPGARVSFGAATFIYAVTTIGGALSMLPGGLGVQEAGMAGLLVALGRSTRATASAATILTRLATLWFAVALGLVALGWFRRRFGGPAMTEADLPANADPERAGGRG